MRPVGLGIVLLASCLVPKPHEGGTAASSEPVETRAEADDNLIVGVVETSEGDPAAGAWVAINEPGGRLIAAIETDGNGRFRVPRPTERFAVTVTSRQGLGVFVPADSARAGSSLPIRLGATNAGLTLQGQLILVGGNPPSPLLIALARISNDEGDIFVAPVSAKGTFSVVVPPGEYFVRPQSSEVLAAGVRVSGAADERVEMALDASLRVPAPRQAVEWLADEAIALTSSAPEDRDDDLAPLGAALGDARIIGVGESTHGTAEFFRIKHRLFKRLVAEHGVTVLAMEANVADAEVVDDYVRRGRGTADDALAHLFLVWQTEEVRDLLAWMRAYNADPKHKRKLRFHGYDVQDAREPIARVRAYLRKVSPASEALLAPLAPLEKRPSTRGMVELTPEEEAQTLAAATRLVEAFTSKRKAFVARSKPGEYAVNLHYAQIIGQAQARYAADTPGQQFTQRDRGMAENVAWIADQTGNNARIMVWAHNGHVRLESEGLLGRSMGSRLRERFEQDYVSIGFVLNRGEYRAVPDPKLPRESVLVPVDASAPGYLAETLSRVGAPIFAIDLRRAPAGPVRDWLSAPHLVHSCGWLVSDAERLGTVASITKQFDLVIYIDQTTGATPLRVQPAERARG